MDLTPDQVIFLQWGPLSLNATILYTWLVMAMLVVSASWVTSRLSTGPQLSRWQNLLEVIVDGIRQQIRELSRQEPTPYLPFIGTLFLFIALCNILSVVPGFRAPTGSLSTTAALAICVLVAVPFYGVRSQGLGGYLRQYVRPTPFMLPFNLMGELTRTLALAVRLFGNVMSGYMIGAILLAVVPLFVPIFMQALGLLTGLIQAYIFAILAMVYIAAATRVRHKQERQPGPTLEEEGEY